MLLELVKEIPQQQLHRFVECFLLKSDKGVRQAAVKVLKRQASVSNVCQALI